MSMVVTSPDLTVVAHYLKRWGLTRDGDPIVTRAAWLLPVRFGHQPAMLRLSEVIDERQAGALMEWWDGNGAAHVFARDNKAILIERAMGRASLADMARSGRDDEACRILCDVAAQLHAPRPTQRPDLTPLAEHFRELAPTAATHGGVLARCWETAQGLLAEPRDIRPLHGDLHHDNVLDFEARGWLAIDPTGVLGERSFDFANIFTNPDLSDATRPVAIVPGRFARRLDIVAEAANLDRKRLLQWIVAWTGLSAAWFISDDDPLAAIDLQIAELAMAELAR